MSELSGNDKIVEAGEVRAYKRLLVPRKETARINELAINDAGSLVTTSSAGVQQIIGPAPVPVAPGFAAVSAADGTSITRSVTVTGSVSATAFNGTGAVLSAECTTPLVKTTAGSGTDLTLNADSGMLVVGQDNLLTSVPPSVPITVTTTAPGFTVSLEKASVTCGTMVINTPGLAGGGSANITFPRKNIGIDDIATLLTVQDGQPVDPNLFYVNKGAVTYTATTFTVEIYFYSTTANNRRVQYFNIQRQ